MLHPLKQVPAAGWSRNSHWWAMAQACHNIRATVCVNVGWSPLSGSPPTRIHEEWWWTYGRTKEGRGACWQGATASVGDGSQEWLILLHSMRTCWNLRCTEEVWGPHDEFIITTSVSQVHVPRCKKKKKQKQNKTFLFCAVCSTVARLEHWQKSHSTSRWHSVSRFKSPLQSWDSILPKVLGRLTIRDFSDTAF